MPRRPCIHRDPRTHVGCPNYAREGDSRCEEHAKLYQRNRQRAPSSTVTWKARWKVLRAQIIRERQRPDGSWWCEIGAHVITDRSVIEVDHRQAVADGGAAYDPGNLRISCAHHNRSLGGKLRQERKRKAIEAARARRRAR